MQRVHSQRRHPFPSRSAFLILLLVGLVVFVVYPGKGGFFLRDGDAPVAFVGDSITQHGGYAALIETFVLARYPSWDVSFHNLGVGGDTAGFRRRGGLDHMLRVGIGSLQPKVVTLMFGMNDAREPLPEGLERFERSLRALIGALKKQGIRVLVISSTPEEGVGTDSPGGSAYNFQLWKYVATTETIAAELNVEYVDLFTPFLRAIEYAQSNLPDFELVPDGVHPEWPGHLLMANRILHRMRASPIVTRATIDFHERRVTSGEGCTVEMDRAAPADELRFTRIDSTLPWPLPDDVSPALQLAGFEPLETLSDCRLRVLNLPQERYEVLVDDESLGTFDRAELEQGINFTLLPGAIRTQTRALFDAVLEKNRLTVKRHKDVQMHRLPEWILPRSEDEQSEEARGVERFIEAQRKVEVERLDREILAANRAILSLRQPRPRRWRVAPVAE
ncbi:MAG: SGNH/GDSL hydrolase family protein [Verrucomicrobiia bacterium]